ncbi:thioredoxin domain-containing protein 11 isoform X2 [Callorhinchus milii]|nr:thioredoxin domain-containing protein 11 isoform X2 [Callorhinchus milii]
MAPPPVRFFSHNSPVIDLYMGQLDHMERYCHMSEVTFVMFYAPWCGESISVRGEIEQIARKLWDQVLFLAINCWWHQGKCRKQMNMFYYPVIHLYHRRFGPIEYKGPLTAPYIQKFIRQVMSPLQYIPTQATLLDFLSHYEPGILGYFEFNASPQPPGYLTLYISALHALKSDYQGTIRFGVITSKKVAEEISVTNPGTIYMHRHFNSSLVFPHDLNFTAVNLYTWAFENRETFIRWLRPHGGKSLLLNNELKKGPALLLFLPFNPLHESQPLMDEIKEVAFQYHNCQRTTNIHSSLQHTQGAKESDREDPSTDSSPHPVETHFLARKSCCNTIMLPQCHSVSRMHNICELCINHTVRVKPRVVSIQRCNFMEMEAALDSFYLNEQLFLNLTSNKMECTNFLSSYSPFNYYSACCRTFSSPLTNSKAIHTLSPSELFYNEETIGVASHSSFPHVEDSASTRLGLHHSQINITGLICNTNKTLNFYLLDSNLHWSFATRLGANESADVKEFATVVNLHDEVHYVLDQKQMLDKSSIENIIKNYSSVYSPLNRHLVANPKAQAQEEPLITEITTQIFDSIVLDPEKNVLLLYYTQWCGFCTVLNHLFIQVAILFRSNNRIAIARINVAKNDLPWEYMVDHFPTILFFPSIRKDLSVKYPEDLPLTVPNLVRFILLHSTRAVPEDPTHSCNPDCVQKAAELQQDRIDQLESEIKKLRAEIKALSLAEEQVAFQLSATEQEKRHLKLSNHVLQEKNKELKRHNEKLQHLYTQRSTELAETAEKLKEIAAVSENLLTENTLLKLYMTTVEETLKDDSSPSLAQPLSEESGSASTAMENTSQKERETQNMIEDNENTEKRTDT